MRIIAGKEGGRAYKTPSDKRIRPTDGRAKEAIFSIVWPYIKGIRVLDLFSGTGGIGYEFLSRGANYVHFNDLKGDQVNTIKKNIETFSYEDRSKVTKLDFRRLIKLLEGEKFDIIYIDPPYGYGMEKEAQKLIEKYAILEDDGLLIIESQEEINDEYPSYELIDKRNYGLINVGFYKRSL